MIGHEIWVIDAGESEAVNEEKAEDGEDGNQDAVPQFAIHAGLDVLFALDEILHREIEGVQGPYVEGSQCAGEG